MILELILDVILTGLGTSAMGALAGGLVGYAIGGGAGSALIGGALGATLFYAVSCLLSRD